MKHSRPRTRRIDHHQIKISWQVLERRRVIIGYRHIGIAPPNHVLGSTFARGFIISLENNRLSSCRADTSQVGLPPGAAQTSKALMGCRSKRDCWMACCKNMELASWE